mmetsp:Transcript_24616/g.55712  ORF Transcript_24616/g.55712 Transcript_24616/m.55712 type:complete len:301 (+) Transcript_24616:381-1283(+)
MCAPDTKQPRGDVEIPKTSGARPSAIRRMAPFILSGLLFDTALYFAVHSLLPRDLAPEPRYCPSDDPGCARRDLLAFQLTCSTNLIYLGVTGFRSFYVTGTARSSVPQTPRGRYFGNNPAVMLPEADRINAAIVVFQGWDLVASVFFEEHRTPIMMTHHALALACGWFCLWYEVNPYYAVYFGGVSEFSSIFLVFAQSFEYFPPERLADPGTSLGAMLTGFQLFCQAGFVVTFFLFRILGWFRHSVSLMRDARYIVKHGLLERFSPGSGWFLYFLITMSVLLGGLQIYWMHGIIVKLSEM